MDKERIRVILRNIQIHDNMEPAWEDEGEFRFKARVIADKDIPGQEMTLPSEDAYYKVSDHPARNRIYLNKVLFEGEVEGRLQVEIRGEELDRVSSNNELEPYVRTWEGDPALPADLDNRSADTWLLEQGQSARARRQVWDPLARVAPNFRGNAH